uniref:Ribonuclease 3-like protein 2 n=1 Tax=Nicotiana tabacum TaxID=4097 RepID=A0A1S4BSL0_TOBAC|nr:PREDICTED: ribonuclease 3-like protein 2 [Nicotiana tabacum]
MQSPESCLSCSTTLIADEDEEVADVETPVKAVEKILNYKFLKPKLLEEALAHPSCIDSVSYKRLEIAGDAALGLAVVNLFYLEYPELVQGQLSLLRSANVSTEKLARVAVRHGLYKYVRCRATAALDEKVKEFVITVQQEEQSEFYGGAMKAPKVLANIVESVAAAVYVDCGFDPKNVWLIFRGLLEPIITLDLLEEQPQPVTLLYELCQKVGKKGRYKALQRRRERHS